MSTKKIYIYHHTDDDGYGGGAAIYNWLKFNSKYFNCDGYNNINDSDIFTYAVDYTKPLPDIEDIKAGDIVFYVDYSFSTASTKDQFKMLHLRGVTQYWLDHHHSSKIFIDEIEALNSSEWVDNPFPINNIYFDERIAGAMIASIFPEHTCDMNDSQLGAVKGRVPNVILFISDWDLFEFEYSNTRSFHYGLSMIEDRLNIRSLFWREIFIGLDVGISKIIDTGKLIIAFNDKQNNRGLLNAYVIKVDDREIVTMNRPGDSTIFVDAYDVFGIVMPYAFNGNNWKYSIFSKTKDPESENFFDCESLAKKYGGGGHKCAAGFVVEEPVEFEFVCKLYDHPKWIEYKESLKEE